MICYPFERAYDSFIKDWKSGKLMADMFGNMGRELEKALDEIYGKDETENDWNKMRDIEFKRVLDRWMRKRGLSRDTGCDGRERATRTRGFTF